MVWRYGVMGLGLLAVLGGCQGTETAGQLEPTTATAATDADDDGSGEILRDGARDRGGELPDVGESRDPRFGRGGLSR